MVLTRPACWSCWRSAANRRWTHCAHGRYFRWSQFLQDFVKSLMQDPTAPSLAFCKSSTMLVMCVCVLTKVALQASLDKLQELVAASFSCWLGINDLCILFRVRSVIASLRCKRCSEHRSRCQLRKTAAALWQCLSKPPPRQDVQNCTCKSIVVARSESPGVGLCYDLLGGVFSSRSQRGMFWRWGFGVSICRFWVWV